jgi:hypothetical protein
MVGHSNFCAHHHQSACATNCSPIENYMRKYKYASRRTELGKLKSLMDKHPEN